MCLPVSLSSTIFSKPASQEKGTLSILSPQPPLCTTHSACPSQLSVKCKVTFWLLVKVPSRLATVVGVVWCKAADFGEKCQRMVGAGFPVAEQLNTTVAVPFARSLSGLYTLAFNSDIPTKSGESRWSNDEFHMWSHHLRRLVLPCTVRHVCFLLESPGYTLKMQI